VEGSTVDGDERKKEGGGGRKVRKWKEKCKYWEKSGRRSDKGRRQAGGVRDSRYKWVPVIAN
jgi:hypothetical protein